MARSNKAALFHGTGIRKLAASERKYYGRAGRGTSVLFPGRRHVNIGRTRGIKHVYAGRRGVGSSVKAMRAPRKMRRR